MEKNELITVVVPIYKVEQYLNRCVDSIINQTYKNLDIILVDDGSPDNCGKICDTYANDDKRVRVIHKENGGLSDARNCAIELAKGDYITFIDSDDYVSNNYVEYLYDLIKKHNSDISCCSFLPFYEVINEQQDKESFEILSSEEALEKLYYQKQLTTSAWGKLYKKKFFNEIRFPKGEICEDLDTIYRVFALSNKIVISNQKLYYYLQRPDSIINSKFSLKRMKAIEFAFSMLNFTIEKFPNLVSAARNRLFMEAIFIAIQIPRKSYKTEQKEIYDIIKQNRSIVLKDKNSKKWYRFIALLSFFGIAPVRLFFQLKCKIGG